MKHIEVLAEEVLVKVDGKRVLCKAVLVSDKGGHVVSYLLNGLEVKSQPLYRSPYKEKVKELKAKRVLSEQEQPIFEQSKPVEKPVEKPIESSEKLIFEFYNIDGKPLSPSAVETVCRERDNKRLKLMSTTPGKDGSKRDRFKCIDTGFLFDVITKPTA